MLEYLELPQTLHQNAPDISAAGHELTGKTLIDLATRSIGKADLKDTAILDIGCGVRFTQTIINKKIPIKSYTGVDVNETMIKHLNDKVAAHDSRFKYAHWNMKNDMYNPSGKELTTNDSLPIEGKFDVIWLFSVFTHLNASDALSILKLLKQYLQSNGKLFFSAFIDDDIDNFEDRVETSPLLHAYFGKNYMQSLLFEAGWIVNRYSEPDPKRYIQHYFVCSPS